MAAGGLSQRRELSQTKTVEELPTWEPSFSQPTTSDEVDSEASLSDATVEKITVAEENFTDNTRDKSRRQKTRDIRDRKNIQSLPNQTALPGAIGISTAWMLGNNNSGDESPGVAANTPTNEDTDTPTSVESSQSAVGDRAPEAPTPANSPQVATDSTDGGNAAQVTAPESAASPEKAVPATTPTASGDIPSAETAAPAKESSSKSIEFSDLPEKYWAEEFIYQLAEANFISGFPDGSFKPERAMIRAEFAAHLNGVFGRKPEEKQVEYKDVPDNYWAKSAIELATKVGALNGYPDGDFRPDKSMPRVEILASLVRGLNLTIPSNVDEVLEVYKDKDKIPAWAKDKIAAATVSGLVVNYPDRDFLNPNETASRADVAVMVYQALVWRGRLKPLDSEYVVNLEK